MPRTPEPNPTQQSGRAGAFWLCLGAVAFAMKRNSLRGVAIALGLLGAGALFTFGALYAFAFGVRPDLQAPAKVYTPAELAAAAKARDVTIDTKSPPVTWREVDYAARGSKPWRPKGEPAFLAELVRERKLPPVAERVGAEPLVLEGAEGTGRYGGTWHRISSSVVDLTVIQGRMSGAMLVRWSPEGYPIVPHVAKSYEVSPDHRVFTFHLRRGMKWSDGALFTADDILFWWNQDITFLRQEPLWMRSGGKLGRVEKIDALTVRFIFDQPNGIFLEDLCNTPIYALPAHYLAKFHPRDGDPELIVRYMRELSLTSPMAVYARMKDPLNPECPRLWPWVYRTQTAGPPYVFVRNPYFFAVDPAGNQLPYIDRVAFDVKPQNQIGLAASLGEISLQERQIRYEDYTLLMRERERGGYDVYHWFQGARSMYTIFPNLNRRIEPDRPETRWKHELLNRKEFRQALSLAIDRREIIRAEFNGQSEPAQVDPGPGSPFHSPELFKSFVEHDPARANALLDSIGLAKRDRDGMRTFPDGTRMTFFLHTTDYTGPGPSQIVIDDWEAVGLRVVHKNQARPLWQAQQTALEHDFSVWTSESDFYPMVQPRLFVPTALHAFNAPAFGVWYLNGGMFGDHRALERPGAEEPPLDHPLRRAMELYSRATQTADASQQVELFREIQKIAADNVWTISIGTSPPQPVIVKRGLRNVPRNAIVGSDFTSPSNAGIETFFFESPQDPPSVVAQTKLAMTEVTPEPRQRAADRSSSPDGAGRDRENPVGRLIRWLFLTIAVFGVGMVALRHPFVGRRVLIMAPTLAIISVLVFVAIQLPPGDYLTSRVIELEMIGDEDSTQLERDLREQFHTDEPMITRYARWMGLRWFITFDPIDAGLLQGNLGRTVESNRLVNDVVGDRIVLTVLISVATILFTWAVALPMGIFSAVRQYSLGDHLLTFVGFVGACVPNFLLALLLIHFAKQWFGVEVAGLFSPEYAIQSEWTWGKFLDMLKHVWVPVVVLGLGGTAGMIRVMRGNLLDELRRPYVTTARAKGLRPLRLLLKYPVRLALNPFVSGLGALFPQLVSGGAVVAIVLALPTVGPLMVSALMTQDMYLAGSMLMVLSLLGVAGTLVSDLLLLALDPRIRFEGGTR